MNYISRLAPGLAGALLLSLALPADAQNLLQNGGFEDIAAPAMGRNAANFDPATGFLPGDSSLILPWRRLSIHALQLNGTNNDHVRLLRVDGPGGYQGNYSQPYPAGDASGAAPGEIRQFIGANTPYMVWQSFTAPCSGEAVVHAWVARSSNLQEITTGRLGIEPIPGGIPPLPTFSNGTPYANPEASALLQRLTSDQDAAQYVIDPAWSKDEWHEITFSKMLMEGEEYAFAADLQHAVNLDEVSVTYAPSDMALKCVGSVGSPVGGLPDGPDTPTGPVGDPDVPSGPVGPSGTPAEPDTPDGHGDPYNPDGSGTPGGSGKPDNPDTPDLPEAKQIFLKKACEAPVADIQNGQPGMAWRCEVTVAAIPAPFAGSFQFTEDASNISGANGQITGFSASPSWSCPGLPAAQTSCTIAGADFDASGVETLTFDLFAPADGPVAWKNCVAGLYAAGDDKREIKGNCDATEWKPERPRDPDPEKVDISKTCTELHEERHNGTLWGLGWQCDVTVTVNPAPFSGSFTFLEDAGGAIGASGAQIISVNANPGWTCTPAPGNGQAQTSCTIAGTDFDPSGQEVLHFELFADMSGVPEQPVTWKNCVSGASDPAASPREVSDCVTSEWAPPPPPEPLLDVAKTCDEPVPAGDGWDISCTITVTGANLAPGLGITLYDTLGANGSASVTASALSQPTGLAGLNCATNPAAPGLVSYCLLTTDDVMAAGGSLSFPYQGHITAGTGDTPGAQNCTTPALFGDPDHPEACVDLTLPDLPEPSLDISKTCDDPVPAGSTGWDVSCTVTVTGADLPPGLTITLYDVLTGSNGALPQSAAFSGPAGLAGGVQCGSTSGPGMVGRHCAVSTDDLMAAGGTLSFPYTSHIGLGTGNAPEAMNCASFQLRDVQGNGVPIGNVGVAQCVNLTLPPLPTTTGGTAPDCGVDVLFVVDRSGSMRWYNRIAQVRSGVQMAQNAFAGNGSDGGLIVFNQLPHLAVPLPDPLASNSIANTMASLQAFGGTRWDLAFALTRQVVTAAAEKPLVLFITDGVPNRPWQWSSGAVNDIRAQGSRIIGVTIGAGTVTQQLTALLGNNVANTAAGDIPDPFTDDVVVIPNGANMATIFSQMAQAYCPQRGAQTDIGNVIDLRLPAQPYEGDDGPQPAEPAPQPTQEPSQQPAPAPSAMPAPPVLQVEKHATGPCRVDEGRRQYRCEFRIDVHNGGNAPYDGPIVIVDQPGSPRPLAVRASGAGWQCGRLRQGEITCMAQNVRLEPGETTGFALQLRLPGQERAGRWRNCAVSGLPQNRRGRVALAQRIMNGLGIDAGPVDGQPGPRTYRALNQLRARLGLPDSRAFDDALFAALGLPVQGPQDCASVDLPAMPKPALQCDPATTRATGGACACTDPQNMVRRSATQCACRSGLPAINGMCPSIRINPVPGKDTPNGDNPNGEHCRISLNGICLQ